jgi:hypothetical protein
MLLTCRLGLPDFVIEDFESRVLWMRLFSMKMHGTVHILSAWWNQSRLTSDDKKMCG